VTHWTNPIAVFARDRDARSVRGYSDLAGHRVAVVAGNLANLTRLREAVPDAELIEVKSALAGLKAVYEHKSYAFAGYSAFSYLITKHQLIGVSPAFVDIQEGGVWEPCMGVRADWPELIPILNKAIASITEEERAAIGRRWVMDTPEPVPEIELTEEERAWLAEHPVIKIGIGDSWAPFVYQKSDGGLEGYDVDMLARINELTGADIQLVAGPWKDIVEQAKRREIDGLAESAVVENRREHFAFTEPYNVAEYAAATLPEKAAGVRSPSDLKGKRIAHLKGNAWVENIVTSLGEVQIVEAKSEEDAFRLVMEGKADFAMIPTHQYARLRAVFHEALAIAYVFRDEEHILKAVYSIRKDWPELVSIINKALSALGEMERQAILEKWVPVAAEALPAGLALPEQFDKINFLLRSLAAIFLGIALVIAIAWVVRGRPKHLTIRRRLLFVSFIFAALIVSIATFVTILLEGERMRHSIDERRRKSLDLAFELKQSSDDLTRFARTYAVTGDPKYERYFRAITAIRDGKQAHPREFSLSYWDQVAAGVVELDQDGELYSIEQKIIDIGLADEERAKLSLAKRESDDLINLENTAMNAVKGLYKDDDGQFTIKGTPDLARARELLHGQVYHDAKARIMEPINEFFALLEWRTTHELNRVHNHNYAVLFSVTILVAITIAFAIYVFFVLKRRIISPLALLQAGAQTIEGGDYSHHIDLSSKDEVGSLATAFNLMTSSIKEHTSRLRSIINTAVDGIILIDANGLIEEFSPTAERIFGHAKGEVLRRNVKILMPEHYHDEYDNSMASYLRGGESNFVGKQREFVGLRKNGEIFPMEIAVAEAIIDDERHFTASVRDITETKQAREELQKLSQAVEQSSAIVVITNLQGDIEYVNPKFTKVTGYTLEEALGQTPRILNSSIHPPEFYRNLWQTITRGGEWRGEFCNRKKNGDLYWENASISSIRDAEGNITHFVAVKEDITEQKRAEQKLLEAKEGAEAANRAKSDFLANMSHEIRTPMNAIIGFSEVLSDQIFGELNQRQARYVNNVLTSGRHLLELINDILDLAKVEAGRMELELSLVNIKRLLENSMVMIKEKAMKHGISLDLRIPEELANLKIQVEASQG